MDAFEFVDKYASLVELIAESVTPEVYGRLMTADPHDMVTPDAHIVSISHAIGIMMVYALHE